MMICFDLDSYIPAFTDLATLLIYLMWSVWIF